MRGLPPVLVLLAACSAGHRFEHPAAVSLLGAEARLETWDAEVAEGTHLHPMEGATCLETARLMGTILEASADPRTRTATDTVAALVEEMAALAHGAAWGGPGRLTLALRRYPDGRGPNDEAIMVTVPALGEAEEERTFAAPDLAAGCWRIPPGTGATLERGRVDVRRRGPGRYEFTLFLVLRPVPPGRPSDRLLAVTRVEAAAPPPRNIR